MPIIKVHKELYPLDDTRREPLPGCLTQYTGFLVSKAHQHLWTRFTEQCRGLRLEGPHACILHLLGTDGSMSQQQLSKALRIDRTSMVKLVDCLEEKKFARRQNHPKDRRMYLVEITAAGRKALTTLQKVAGQMEQGLLADFSEPERKVIRRALISLAG